VSDTNGSSTGLGLVSATTLVFVINKMTNAGDIAGWSWWWVLSPLWISFLLVMVLAIVAGIVKAVKG
jgi:hypothetical protein